MNSRWLHFDEAQLTKMMWHRINRFEADERAGGQRMRARCAVFTALLSDAAVLWRWWR